MELMPDYLRKELTISNVVLIVGIVLSIGGAYASSQGRDAEHDRRLAEQARRLDDVETQIREARETSSRILQAVAAMQTDISYLRASEDKRRP